MLPKTHQYLHGGAGHYFYPSPIAPESPSCPTLFHQHDAIHHYGGIPPPPYNPYSTNARPPIFRSVSSENGSYHNHSHESYTYHPAFTQQQVPMSPYHTPSFDHCSCQVSQGSRVILWGCENSTNLVILIFVGVL
jgi:hypothetical protein